MKKTALTLALTGALVVGSVGAYAIASSDTNRLPASQETTTKIAEQSNMEEVNSLYFAYDESKYELVRGEGEKSVSLMDRDSNSNIFLSWKHIPSQHMERAAGEECATIESNDGFSAEIATSDLKIPSTKVVDCYEEDGSTTSIYFIDDNAGGVYRVFVNTMAWEAFAAESEAQDLLNSIKVLSPDENPNLEKVKEIEVLG